MSKKYVIYEKCPVCDEELEEIPGVDGFIIDWWCGKCGISWTLEDLEIEETIIEERKMF